MKKKIIISTVIILIFGTAGMLIYLYLEYLDHDRAIFIGATTDMSIEDDYGRNIRRAIDFRVNQVNEEGGINGTPLEIIWRDTECEYDGGKTAGEYLIEKEDVRIIIGGVCEDSAKGLVEITAPKDVILISPGASAPSLAAENDYFYRTYPSGTAQGELLAKYLNNHRYKKVAELISPNVYTEGISEIVQNKYEGIYSRELIEYETDDFTSQIESLRETNPEALFINVDFAIGLGTLMAQMVEKNWCPPILGDEMFVIDVGESYLPEIQAYQECMNQGKILGASFAIDETSVSFLELEEEFSAWSGVPFTYKTYAATAIDSVNILVEVLGYIKNTRDTDEIKDSLDVIQHLGFSGPITFTKTGNVRNDYFLYEFNGEEFIPFVEE